jgi:anti-sigma B factor antagonist
MILEFNKRQIEPGMMAVEIKGSIHCGPECARLERLVEELVGTRETRIIFDMAGVTHMDSAAIGSIVRCMMKLKTAGGGLKIACAQPMVDYSLKITKLDKLLPNYRSVAEAAAGFTSAGAVQA